MPDYTDPLAGNNNLETKDADFTLDKSHLGKTLILTKASKQSVNIPIGMPQRFTCKCIITGASGAVLVAGSGVTINSVGGVLDTSERYAEVILTHYGNNVWQASNFGNAVASGGVWGGITGTLADQVDLKSALDAKLDALKLLRSYLATTVTYNDNAVLADTALSVTVESGGNYTIELVVHGGGNTVRSLNLDFAGTAAIGNFIGQWNSSLPDGTTVLGARVTAVGTDYNDAALDGLGNAIYRFVGSVNFGGAGTFLLRGAQASANASDTTILRGSTLSLTKCN